MAIAEKKGESNAFNVKSRVAQTNAIVASVKIASIAAADAAAAAAADAAAAAAADAAFHHSPPGLSPSFTDLEPKVYPSSPKLFPPIQFNFPALSAHLLNR